MSATNSGGTTASSSAQSAVVGVLAPVNSVLPTISGSTVEGQSLKASNGTWSGSPTSFSYQWQDCDSSGTWCAAISGATSSSYALASSDVGHRVVVSVSAFNAGGSASAASAATAAVTAASGGGCSVELSALTNVNADLKTPVRSCASEQGPMGTSN